MKELVERIAKSIVDNPNEVEVTMVEGDQTTVIELTVAKSDIGKIIGKKGINVSAIRTLLNAAGGKKKKDMF
jgi:predicted RNA-binding protein YlqC (UPF0109 family)